MNIDSKILYDNEGYLMNPENWTESVSNLLAESEGIHLNTDYWLVINFMRDYWSEHRIAPDVRHVIDFLAGEKNCKKKEAKEYLFKLFPYGYVKQACRIAGMQRPRAWSTG
jgi:TusE/DsrC/DsvC family sulfur relay protein